MSNHPRRFYGTNDLHFINCSCYHRQPWLATPQRRDLFLIVFEQVRQRYRFVVLGYVVMPEHIHLLIGEPEQANPSRVMPAIKQGFARRVLKAVRRRRVSAQAALFALAAEHVWQKRFYDFNVFTARNRMEKLRYMHLNPVKRGLVAEPKRVALEQLSELCFREAGPSANE